jgi:hypothetical protein
MFSRLLVIGSISLGLLSNGAAKAVDKTDVEEAKLQVALAQVGVQMAMVKIKQIRVKVEALEQAVPKGLAVKTDLEMTRLEMEAAELNVKAAEINVARANLVVERTERAVKAGDTKASSKKAEEGQARKKAREDVKQGTEEAKKAGREEGSKETEAVLAGKGTTTFVGCHFAGWGRDGSKSPCIDVQGGAALIQACDFFKERKPQLRVGAKAAGVTVTGCRLQGGEQFEIADEVKGHVQAGLNLTR